MPSKSEQVRINDILLAELFPELGYCRAEGTIVRDVSATGDYPVGLVLENAVGGYTACTDGDDASAILLERIPQADIVAGNVQAAVLVRGPAIFKTGSLTIAAAELADATAALAALGIEGRALPATFTEGLGY